MRARSRAALPSTLALAVLAAMVVIAATAPATAVAPASSDSAASTQSLAPAQADVPPRNGTAFIIRLRPDGDARWTVAMTFELENESDRAAFQELAEQYERGDTDIGIEIETFRRARRAANATVDRTMAIRAVERNSTVIPGENGSATGRLTLNFTWTNFGRTSDERLRFGSAFNTTSGTWFPGLTAGQTLEVHPPRGYGVFTAPVRPRAGVLRWEGPASFEAGDLAAVYERNGGPTPTPTPDGPTPTPPTETPPPAAPLPSELLLVGGLGGILLLLLLLGGVLLVLHRRESEEPDGTTPAGANADAEEGGAAGAGSGAAATTDDTSTTDGTTEADSGADETDTALLSDEERVERLLERNGGRMKQANIVSETGWSNAKVSQLLSAMDEADRIDKLRIGRENLISLPDEDVTELDEE